MTKQNELVINFHMTEACNYRCDYCYATWDTGCHTKELHRTEGKVESLIDKLASYFLADNPLKEVMGYHSIRLNFAGGEPMLLGKRFNKGVTSNKSQALSTCCHSAWLGFPLAKPSFKLVSILRCSKKFCC